jgi:hypothetical protein
VRAALPGDTSGEVHAGVTQNVTFWHVCQTFVPTVTDPGLPAHSSTDGYDGSGLVLNRTLKIYMSHLSNSVSTRPGSASEARRRHTGASATACTSRALASPTACPDDPRCSSSSGRIRCEVLHLNANDSRPFHHEMQLCAKARKIQVTTVEHASDQSGAHIEQTHSSKWPVACLS